jgi:two-component system, response regulator
MRSPFVLLVEDNADDVALMLRVFARAGVLGAHEIVVTRDGAEALEFLFGADAGAHALPRAIFLDLKMPRVDGLEVLRRVRADARTRLTPVVVLTSSDEERDVRESYHLGANSYVRKPEDSSRFSETVTTVGRYWFGLNRVAPEASAT